MKYVLSCLFLLFQLLPTIAQPSFSLSVPYTNDNGKLIVQATINGQKGHFLLDTGAPCCITDAFAQRIALQQGTQVQGEDSNGQTVQTQVVLLDSLRLGSVSFRSVQAMRLGKGDPTELFGIDGIIGYSLFAMGAIRFDGQNQHFLFSRSASSLGLPTTLQGTAMKAGEWVPLVPVQLSPTAVDTVMFDSGASSVYQLSSRTYNRLVTLKAKGWKHLATGHGILSFGAAGLEKGSEKHRVLFPHVSFGKSTFKNVTAITTESYHSLMGSEILKYGDIVIDYRTRMFYFLPRTTTPPDLYESEWDVVITVMNDHLTAGIVWDERLPIRSGDRIVAVNGQRFDKVNLIEATTQALVAMPGNKATITFVNSRTNKEENVTIKRR